MMLQQTVDSAAICHEAKTPAPDMLEFLVDGSFSVGATLVVALLCFPYAGAAGGHKGPLYEGARVNRSERSRTTP